MLVHKAKDVYNALSSEEKKPFEDKAREAYTEWEKQMEEYKSTAEYKKYDKAMNRISGKPKPKAKAKVQKVTGPEKPPNMPKAPPVGHAQQLFRQAEAAKGNRMSAKEVSEAWMKLGAEGQKPFQEEANAYKAKYDAEFVEFCKTAEGKQYLRLSKAAKKKAKVNAAKEKLSAVSTLKEPKKPASAWIMFGKERGSAPEFVGLELGARAKKLQELWSSLPADEKDVFEKKAAEEKEKYEKELAAFKASPEYKSYAKVLKSTEKKPKKAPKKAAKPAKPAKEPKAKAKAKAGAKKADDSSDSDDQMGSVDSSSSSSSDSDSD